MDIDNETGSNVTNRARLIPKPKPFYGKRNELSAFLGQIDRYFKYNLSEEDAADEEFKIDIISSYLEGNAGLVVRRPCERRKPLITELRELRGSITKTL